MINLNISPEEEERRRLLTNARQSAVRNAWKDEQARVREGMGTRDWTVEEQKELLSNGSVHGYEGQHMKCVRKYPSQAGNPNNIQFLTEDEHLYGAHGGNYHNATNGYYDPTTKKMHDFGRSGPTPPPVKKLSNPYVKSSENNRNKSIYLANIDSSKYQSTSSNASNSQKNQSKSNDKSMGMS